MRKNQIKNRIAIIAATAVFMMTGCQSNTGNNEDTKALKDQIAQLEQQVSDLERLLASGTMYAVETEDMQNETGVLNNSSEQSTSDSNFDNNVQGKEDNRIENNTPFPTDADNGQQPQIDTEHSSVSGTTLGQQSALTGIGTTYTMEDLSSMVESFVTKANAAVPSGTMSQDMEQFFAFKQEKKQIDDLLDQHEDELEYLYKKQSLTRDEYKRLERELDRLDDKLDTAKDQLEFAFGIDD